MPVLMLTDEYPELDLLAPVTRAGPSQSLRLEVADPDAVVQRAVAAGAVLERDVVGLEPAAATRVSDSPHGRGGVVRDPSRHRRPFGTSAECHDDQGGRFQLVEG